MRPASSDEKTQLLEDETYRIQSATSFLRMNTLSKILCLLLLFVGMLLVTELGIVVYVVKLDEYVLPYPTKVSCQPVRNEKRPRNLIFFVGDGFGQNYNSYARIMNGGPLAYDKYLLGQHYTQSANNIITDSAAGATAFAAGYRTNNEFVSTLPNRSAIGTIIEAAIATGNYVTGVITNDRVSGATPASFMAHSDNRNQIRFISKQLITKSIDVILGGGGDGFTAETLHDAQAEYGYNLISSKQAFANLSLPALGIFSDTAMPFLIDRTPSEQATLPTVDEMVQFALTVLDKKASAENKGLVLIVENGNIDVSGHHGDATAMYYEVKDLSSAFERAVNYSVSRRDTLVLLTADHETGGQAIGNYEDANTQNLTRLFAVKRSTDFFSLGIQFLPLNDTASILKLFADNSFITSLTPDEWASIFQFQLENNTRNYTFSQWIGQLIGRRSRIGWTAKGHTAQNVNVYGYGPFADQFCGMYENRLIGSRLASIFNWDLQAITDSLKNFNTTSPIY